MFQSNLCFVGVNSFKLCFITVSEICVRKLNVRKVLLVMLVEKRQEGNQDYKGMTMAWVITLMTPFYDAPVNSRCNTEEVAKTFSLHIPEISVCRKSKAILLISWHIWVKVTQLDPLCQHSLSFFCRNLEKRCLLFFVFVHRNFPRLYHVC